MSRTKNVSRNFISGVLYQVISVLLPFIARTILIYKLGVEYVGLSSLFGSILMVLSISELGFGNAMVFHMYKPIEEGNTEEVNKLLNLYRTVYRIVGVVVGTVGLALSPFLQYFIEGDAPPDINLYVIYFIYLANTVFSYLFCSYRRCLFNASQRVDYESNINTITSVIRYGSQIALLLAFSNYYIYALVLPASQLLNNLLVYLLSKKKYPHYKCEGKLEKTKLKDIFRQVRGLLLQRIGQVVYESVDSIVVSTFLGLSVLGVYNNYFYIVTALTGFIAIIYNSLRPSVGNSIVMETVDKNREDFYKFNFTYVWIDGWMAITLFVLYQPFMKLWVGEANMLPVGIPLLLALYFFCAKECNMLAVYAEAAGLWYENRFTPLIASVLNLGLNILMVNKIGLYGVVLSSLICSLIVSDIGFMRTLYKYYFKDLKEGIYYLIKQYLYIPLYAGIGFLTWWLCQLIEVDGVVGLIIRGMICVVLPNAILYIIFRKNRNFTGLKMLLKKR